MRRHVSFASLVIAAATVLIPTASAAQTNILTIPGLAGESALSGFVGQIDIDAISIGYRVQKTSGELSVQMAPLVVTKRIDKSTPKIMEAGAKGATFKTMTVNILSPRGESRETFMKLTLNDVTISDWQFISSHGQIPTEQFTIKCLSYKAEYTEFDSDGNKRGNVTGIVTGTP